MSKLYIVGDQYLQFAEGRDNVLIVSEYFKSSLPPDTDLHCGLGISDWQLHSIQQDLLRRKAPTYVLERFARRPAQRKLTHRHNDTNVLISEPKRTGEYFVFDLILDDREDRLADHVTGQHVSGMVLLEAARQASAVVLETEHSALSKSHAATLARVSANFESFVFPLPTQLLAIEGTESIRAGRVSTYVSVAVWQNQDHVANFQFDIPLTRRDVLTRCEASAARKALT